MSTLKATRSIDNPSSLADYGLDTPKDVMIAEMDDGTRYELQMGIKTPTQTGTYAKRADQDTVFVIADQLVSDLERLVADPKEPPTPTPRPPSPLPTLSPSADTVDTSGTPTP
jgi:hypothetical protein